MRYKGSMNTVVAKERSNPNLYQSEPVRDTSKSRWFNHNLDWSHDAFEEELRRDRNRKWRHGLEDEEGVPHGNPQDPRNLGVDYPVGPDPDWGMENSPNRKEPTGRI